jgi:hypothetical protein
MALSRHKLIRDADKLRYARDHALKVYEGLSHHDAAGLQMEFTYGVFMHGGPLFDYGYRFSNLADCLKVTKQKHVVRQVA